MEGKKGKCESIDPADKEKDVFLAFSVKPLLNCCPISDFIKVQFVAMLFPSKHANVLRGICLLISLVHVDARDYRSAVFQAPRRALSLGPSITSSVPVGTDLEAEEDREHSSNLLS